MSSAVFFEFDTPEDLAAAARHLRASGYGQLDAYTPYSTDVVREALELPPTRLPRWVFALGLFGASAAYFIQWYTVGYLYPLSVGARPPHLPLAFVPITFEMGILAASFTAFFAVLAYGRLVKLWDPVFELPGFEAVSVDHFWLRVNAAAPLDADALGAEVQAFRPLRRLSLGGAR